MLSFTLYETLLLVRSIRSRVRLIEASIADAKSAMDQKKIRELSAEILVCKKIAKKIEEYGEKRSDLYKIVRMEFKV